MRYTEADLERTDDGKAICPIKGCCSPPWASPHGMIRHHANKPHVMCRCGWVGLKIAMHRRYYADHEHGDHFVVALIPTGA